MKLTGLRDAYKDQATIKGLSNVKTFVFDNLSESNEPDQTFRVLLFKPPNSVRLNADQSQEDRINWAIEYFLFDLIGDTKGEATADLWESIENDVRAINKGVVNDNVDIEEIISDVTMERGQHIHGNADLIGIRVLYTLRVFDCLNP